jgi:hypothetical protein
MDEVRYKPTHWALPATVSSLQEYNKPEKIFNLVVSYYGEVRRP